MIVLRMEHYLGRLKVGDHTVHVGLDVRPALFWFDGMAYAGDPILRVDKGEDYHLQPSGRNLTWLYICRLLLGDWVARG